ncbi:MAG: PriCT-2 domain-containing protein [Prevotella sp.]|nr:PriCT-2 domain-containing protein [Prevotella sp.]
MDKKFEMSFFNPPITNKVPSKTMTLEEVAAMIQSQQLAPQTEHLRSIVDKASARAYKGQNLPYVTPSGVFSYCSDDCLIRHSDVLCIDLDGVEDVDGLKRLLIADRHFWTLMAFRSPSGNGVKWFIVIDLTLCDHRMWFHAVRNYLLETYQFLTPKMVDVQCQNPSRACFLCHDPQVYVNLDNSSTGLVFDPVTWAGKSADMKKPIATMKSQPSASQPLHPMEELAKARAVTRELLRRGANIADDYGDYLKLGFALANGLGSDGRELYHELCSQSTKYRETDCERKWQQCLRQTDGRTTIATFYNMAKQAGVDLASIAREFKPESIYNF